MRIISILTILYFSVSCATSRDSILLGAGVGSVIGAGFGAAMGVSSQHNPATSAAVGAVVGAAIGGISGFLEHKRGNLISHSQSKSSPNSKPPTLTMPEVKRVFVPSQIEDNKFIESHWIYVIDKQSTFRLDDNDQGGGKEK